MTEAAMRQHTDCPLEGLFTSRKAASSVVSSVQDPSGGWNVKHAAFLVIMMGFVGFIVSSDPTVRTRIMEAATGHSIKQHHSDQIQSSEATLHVAASLHREQTAGAGASIQPSADDKETQKQSGFSAITGRVVGENFWDVRQGELRLASQGSQDHGIASGFSRVLQKRTAKRGPAYFAPTPTDQLSSGIADLGELSYELYHSPIVAGRPIQWKKHVVSTTGGAIGMKEAQRIDLYGEAFNITLAHTTGSYRHETADEHIYVIENGEALPLPYYETLATIEHLEQELSVVMHEVDMLEMTAARERLFVSQGISFGHEFEDESKSGKGSVRDDVRENIDAGRTDLDSGIYEADQEIILDPELGFYEPIHIRTSIRDARETMQRIVDVLYEGDTLSYGAPRYGYSDVERALGGSVSTLFPTGGVIMSPSRKSPLFSVAPDPANAVPRLITGFMSYTLGRKQPLKLEVPKKIYQVGEPVIISIEPHDAKTKLYAYSEESMWEIENKKFVPPAIGDYRISGMVDTRNSMARLSTSFTVIPSTSPNGVVRPEDADIDSTRFIIRRPDVKPELDLKAAVDSTIIEQQPEKQTAFVSLKTLMLQKLGESATKRYNVDPINTSTTVAVVGEEKSFDVVFYTKGPSLMEDIVSRYEKRLVVASELPVNDVIITTEVPQGPRGSYDVFWIVDGYKVRIDVEQVDVDNNGLVDNLVWVAPYVTHQEFAVMIRREGMDLLVSQQKNKPATILTDEVDEPILPHMESPAFVESWFDRYERQLGIAWYVIKLIIGVSVIGTLGLVIQRTLPGKPKLHRLHRYIQKALKDADIIRADALYREFYEDYERYIKNHNDTKLAHAALKLYREMTSNDIAMQRHVQKARRALLNKDFYGARIEYVLAKKLVHKLDPDCKAIHLWEQLTDEIGTYTEYHQFMKQNPELFDNFGEINDALVNHDHIKAMIENHVAAGEEALRNARVKQALKEYITAVKILNHHNVSKELEQSVLDLYAKIERFQHLNRGESDEK